MDSTLAANILSENISFRSKAMDSTLAANLLLVATIAVFVFLTLLAFLMTEGKPIVVEPLRRRLQERFGKSSRRNVFLGEPTINGGGGGGGGDEESL